jgi:hypothetical protein
MIGGPPRPYPKSVPKKKEPKQPFKKTKAVMQNFDKAAFVRQRGPLCECGECGERGEDAHHALINRMKDHPELDVPENLMLVNHFEHTALRKFSNLEWRVRFWLKQCERFGRPHMIAWVKSLPLKVKMTRLDFLSQEEKAEVV